MPVTTTFSIANPSDAVTYNRHGTSQGSILQLYSDNGDDDDPPRRRFMSLRFVTPNISPYDDIHAATLRLRVKTAATNSFSNGTVNINAVRQHASSGTATALGGDGDHHPLVTAPIDNAATAETVMEFDVTSIVSDVVRIAAWDGDSVRFYLRASSKNGNNPFTPITFYEFGSAYSPELIVEHTDKTSSTHLLTPEYFASVDGGSVTPNSAPLYINNFPGDDDDQPDRNLGVFRFDLSQFNPDDITGVGIDVGYYSNDRSNPVIVEGDLTAQPANPTSHGDVLGRTKTATSGQLDLAEDAPIRKVDLTQIFEQVKADANYNDKLQIVFRIDKTTDQFSIQRLLSPFTLAVETSGGGGGGDGGDGGDGGGGGGGGGGGDPIETGPPIRIISLATLDFDIHARRADGADTQDGAQPIYKPQRGELDTGSALIGVNYVEVPSAPEGQTIQYVVSIRRKFSGQMNAFGNKLVEVAQGDVQVPWTGQGSQRATYDLETPYNVNVIVTPLVTGDRIGFRYIDSITGTDGPASWNISLPTPSALGVDRLTWHFIVEKHAEGDPETIEWRNSATVVATDGSAKTITVGAPV